MSIEEKQSYLREAILEKGINPNDFFEHWSTLEICKVKNIQSFRMCLWKD